MGSADEFFRAMGIPLYREEEEERQGAPHRGRAGSAVGELEELRREAEALHRRFAGGQDPDTRHQGRDGTGSVRVTVGGDGHVTDVELDRGWRRTVGPLRLAGAVLEAVGDASMRRLAAWGEAVANGPAAAVDSSEVNRGPGAHARSPGGAADRRAVQELVSLLEGIEADLEELDRRIDQRVQQQVVGHSPTHQVKVRVGGGGQVTGVEVEHRFADKTDDRGIIRELKGAFHAAYERAGSLGLDVLLDGRLAQLHALGTDPSALLDRLGLGSR